MQSSSRSRLDITQLFLGSNMTKCKLEIRPFCNHTVCEDRKQDSISQSGNNMKTLPPSQCWKELKEKGVWATLQEDWGLKFLVDLPSHDFFCLQLSRAADIDHRAFSPMAWAEIGANRPGGLWDRILATRQEKKRCQDHRCRKS
ncbi:hypothetical protein EUGRSUZ_K03241 [Eucalyptus grandis]|uniref:Uncharacterized protein n=2 Tax=Eucalyptus grandis TaxID=71139 RepID=A0A059A7U6_EUCGR|nr:hypothetical protein EUGRSUZ_K03241 [Eucalyptus grandis]